MIDREALRGGIDRLTQAMERDFEALNARLTRMAQGRRPDAASMAALSAWAGINPANYVSSKVPRFAGSQTLDQVALLFRQDAQLSDDARSKLESIVESAYNALKAAPPSENA